MSGHSRWAGIKHKKAVVDAKRGKIFTRINREITVAARQGGGNPESNPRLRKAIEDAKAANMPQDNIKRAIQKGTGEIPGLQIEETTYEGYGPGGVAIFVEATTDNKNRTTAEIRHVFAKYGGNMGESGSVSWIFESKGYLTVQKNGISEEKITDLALEAGAEDLKADDKQVFEIYTQPQDLESVKEKLATANVKVEEANVIFEPKNVITLEGDQAKQCLDLIEALDEHEDIKSVNSNADISEETAQQLSGGA